MHKYIGYGNMFCWHCGKRVHLGKKFCPHCGARYNGTAKHPKFTYPVNRRISPNIGLGPFHHTFIRFLIKYLIGSIITAIIVLGVIYMPSVRHRNNAKAAVGDELDCACCHNKGAVGENYCDLCGTVLYYDHNGKNMPPVGQ